ncbi:copper transporter 4 [Brachypodium distachyon]|uniref:Copper transport protein n=1 Tax=Brachypodium distachyon TaxID=15368 RepID=A0A0Q3JU91_BRADI|nr:copper transporter 4 [Brachypodium distachyon]KQK15652.1 hypothetical protein BRADI_1g24190v3 [Brachypodium distachyon]|eukprot:XP_010229637.2 copper transporter 4 [Brachypodium distachyon]
MSMPMPPPPPSHAGDITHMPGTDMGMGMGMAMPAMHATFFWAHRAQVLFTGWPGEGPRAGSGMYVLCLLVVLALAALVEAFSAASKGLARRRPGGGAMVSGVVVHAAKMALAYMVMLAAMSFNVGVLLAAVAGHALGFLLARTAVLRRAGAGGTRDDDAAAPQNVVAHATNESEPIP